MRVLLVQNHPIESPGRVTEYLAARNIEYDIAHVYRGDALPPAARYDAVIVFGCPESVSEVMAKDWTKRLFHYMDEMTPTGTPFLGFCFGAQIMAANLGAAVLPNRPKEIGVYTVVLSEDGARDPIFKGFPEAFPVFHWHGDMFDIPAGAKLLVIGADCRNQAFRHGKSVGVQFHLEADPLEVPVWCDTFDPEIPEVGKTPQGVLDEFATVADETRRLCFLLLDNFFADIKRR